MRHALRGTALLFLSLICLQQANAQLVDTWEISLNGAMTMVEAAEAEARANGWNVAIAIVDAGGHLLLFHRMDGANPGNAEAALEKARTSALFRQPTKNFENVIANGRNALIGLEIITPLQGGLPIMVEGKVIGAIGASGATSPQDEQIVQAGIDALRR